MTLEQAAKRYVDLQVAAFERRDVAYRIVERLMELRNMNREFGVEAAAKAIKAEQAKHLR